MDNSLLSLNSNGLAGRQGLVKRIAQTDLHDVAQSWQDLCVRSLRDSTHCKCIANGVSDG